MITFSTSIPPSVNHAYANNGKGGRVLKGAAKEWIEDAGNIAKAAKREQGWIYSQGVKLVMELWAFWPNYRRRDIHNLHKLIADAFEGLLYEDDKWVLIRDMDFDVDRKNPRVEYVVKEWEPDA